jgi:hypothetical protein
LLELLYHMVAPKLQLVPDCEQEEPKADEEIGWFRKALKSLLAVIKSIEPYSSTKGTLREEVCSRLIKPTTQVYLGNVGLLTRPLTCGTIVQTRVQREGRPNIVQGPEALIP